VIPAALARTLRGPDALAATSIAAPQAAAATAALDAPSPPPFRLVLGIALALALGLFALGATPPWALPRHLALVVVGHRETLLVAGLVGVLSIGLGLAVALFGS
jgi:hypothetical protein